MVTALASSDLHAWGDCYASPLNVLTTDPMHANAEALQAVARDRGLDFQIFFAQKSNKCLAFVQKAISLGLGIDTASENEILQSLDGGIASDDLICTAAIKSERLIDTCLTQGIVIAIDNQDELNLVAQRSERWQLQGQIALRIGGFLHQGKKLATRFGFDIDRNKALLAQQGSPFLQIQGIHFHLHGGDPAQRVTALKESIRWWDQLRELGHDPKFIDMGGGIPVSLMEDQQAWLEFWKQHRLALLGKRDSLTYQGHGLGLIGVDGKIHGQSQCTASYQNPTQESWLAEVLDAPAGAGLTEGTLAEALKRRGVQLRCEPGRSLMDGCGMTIARIEYRKQNADGDWLIGLSMNRTQCRTTSDDFLLDPILVPSDSSVVSQTCSPMVGYLVGAYCTESELLSLRKLHFPFGAQRGDLIVFPNTAGYWMHFMESHSHQFPLAKNLVMANGAKEPWRLDAVDT